MRQVVELRAVEGLRNKAVAGRLGLAEGTVKQYWHNALRILHMEGEPVQRLAAEYYRARYALKMRTMASELVKVLDAGADIPDSVRAEITVIVSKMTEEVLRCH
jgi:FixJ family two-component response regulator